MTTHELMCLITHAHAKGASVLKLDTDECTLTVWFGTQFPSDTVVAFLERSFDARTTRSASSVSAGSHSGASSRVS